MRGWDEKILDELGKVARVKSRHRPRNAEFLYGGKYPFIQTSDVNNANYRIADYSQTYSEDGLKQSRLWPKDTLCITIVANIADTSMLGIEVCFPDSIMGFISYDGVSDVRFVKYSFDVLQRKIQQISQGAAQDNLSSEKLLTVKFLVPNYTTQRRIASILSAYDDLIENNLLRIRLLEELAQRTHEEWFVRFRVQGQQLEVDGETGLPRGWRKVKLREVVSYLSRGISPKYVQTGGIPVINQKCIRNGEVSMFQSRLTSTDTRISKEKYIQLYDVLINSTGAGTLGRVAQIISKRVSTTCDIQVSIVRANKDLLSPLLLGFALRSQEDFITNLGKGSTNQLELSRNDLGELVEIIIPDNTIAKVFNKFAKPILMLKSSLTTQNRLLREARDILLPKLMSGEVEV